MAKKVLIADDDKFICKVLSKFITDQGFQVEVAYDGAKTLEKLKSGHFDFLLLDLIMPVKDGFEVLQEMKESGDKTPVVVLSNLSQEEDMKIVKKYKVKNYFVKSDTSMQKVSEYINQLATT